MLVVGSPNVVNENKFKERVDQILSSKQFTNNGSFVRELEEKVASYLGVKHCIAVSNATVALELCLMHLKNLYAGMEGAFVYTPSYTFIATTHACKKEGFNIVFGDIREDFCLDPSNLYNCDISLPVDLYGGTCNYEEYEKPYKITLYDSAHAFGTKYKNKHIGGWGIAQVVSLHATKFLQAFEGGLILTNNSYLDEDLRLFRNFGYDPYCKDIHGNILDIGTNAKMSEIHAAMGLTNLEGIDLLLEKNEENYNLYKKYLPDFCKLIQFPDYVTSNYQYIVVTVDNRDEIIDNLYSNGVVARKYFHQPAHLLLMYPNAYLPNTEKAAKTTMILPTGLSIGKEEIQYICKHIKSPR